MYFAAIGGMQLKHWTDYFRIIGPAIRVLLKARKSEGCVRAEMFKDTDVFFAVSIWDDVSKMKSFANEGLHGRLVASAMKTMAMFYNHTEQCADVPNRQECVSLWKSAMVKRSGRASVGEYKV